MKCNCKKESLKTTALAFIRSCILLPRPLQREIRLYDAGAHAPAAGDRRRRGVPGSGESPEFPEWPLAGHGRPAQRGARSTAGAAREGAENAAGVHDAVSPTSAMGATAAVELAFCHLCV